MRVKQPDCTLSFILILLFTIYSGVETAKGQAFEEQNRSLIIVIDGLRPDYVTPEIMPNLHALGQTGVYGRTHSSIYPTYTRVNSASIGSGSYPGTHGIMHNHMFHPSIEEAFSTGDVDMLYLLDENTGGQLITATSLGEVLEENGLSLLATGTGGLGNTLLQNPRGAGKGIWGARGLFIPEQAEAEATEALGELPGRNGPAGTEWVINSYLYHALGDQPPHATIMWLGETDADGHTFGVGSPVALETVTRVDHHIGKILQAHEENGLTDKVNIFVTSDHGFSSTTREFNLASILAAEGLDEDAMILTNQIYLDEEDTGYMERIVEALQRDPAVGNIYTRPAQEGSSEGIIAGTLSTDVIRWNHERSASIIVSPSWTHDLNEDGYPGTTSFGAMMATHGSDSPYDLHIPLVAYGPDIKQGIRSTVPTSNIDFAPTVLHLMGIDPPASMDGRIMHELLVDGPDPDSIVVQQIYHEAEVTFPDGFRYQAGLEALMVDTTYYLQGAETRRESREVVAN